MRRHSGAVTKFLLSVHVLAAIVFVGPVTVAASMFPRYARSLTREPGDEPARHAAELLHRISRVYAVVGVFVPAFGLATAVRLGVLTNAWLLISVALTAVAAAVLMFVVLPGQRNFLARSGPLQAVGRLGMATGIFNLLWATVVVLMITRPGSTLGT